MKVQDIGTAIVKRLWIVIALVLVSTLVAAVIAKAQSPVYKVEIAVSTSPPINPTTRLPDSSAMLGLAALTPSIANFTESISVADAVSGRLALAGIDIPPEELLKKASAVPEANSASIKITFTDGSPTRVAEIANTWGEVLISKTQKDNPLFDPEFKNLLLQGGVVFTNRAVTPEKPTQPKTFAYIGLGFFVGLVMGLVLVILIEYFNPHFRSAREVEETLGVPVLGTLPREKGARSTAFLSAFGEGSRTWKAYSELRSSLILIPEGAPKSVLAAPATPFEAGPAVAANLAASIANTGRRTLLIDCDLVDGTLSRLMDSGNRPGLSDALEREEDYRSRMVEGKLANLSFLPAGGRSEKSTDLLSLPSFEEELREQESLNDEVVLYAPPLLGSMDAVVVAAQAGASLVIIDADRCTRKAAQEAMYGFERLGIAPMGAVLANVKMKGRDQAAPEREEKAAAPREAAKAAPLPAPAVEKRKAVREKRPVPPAAPATSPAAPLEPPARPEPAAAVEAPPVPAGPVKTGPAAPAPGGTPAPGFEKRETAPSAVPPPVTAAPAARPSEPQAAAARPPVREPSWGTAPAVSTPGSSGDGLRQVRESIADDFRRMGESGAPIPKNWLRALNSDKADVRESATAAITGYYRSFLQRYRISGESVERITESIIRMMRREGEFASMSEEEAQRHLRQMLIDSGARFSGSPAASSPPAPEQTEPERKAAAEDTVEKEPRRQEKKRFRLEARSGRRASGWGRGKGPQPPAGDEEGVDWE